MTWFKVVRRDSQGTSRIDKNKNEENTKQKRTQTRKVSKQQEKEFTKKVIEINNYLQPKMKLDITYIYRAIKSDQRW